jgi:hypothetical protein
MSSTSVPVPTSGQKLKPRNFPNRNLSRQCGNIALEAKSFITSVSADAWPDRENIDALCGKTLPTLFQRVLNLHE